MKTRLLNIWEYLRTSLWFVPGLMVFSSIGLALLMLNLDGHVKVEEMLFARYLHFGTPEGTREVLSTIASSMITVAGVVFSITIVALTLASSQFGPHLLRTFIRNTSNQIVLGTFIATYIYCLIILRAVQSENDAEFVPSLSVSVGMALALINVAVLIYFIHHVSTSIQADSVAAEVHAELMLRMRSQYPSTIEEESNSEPGDTLASVKSHYPLTIDVLATEEGYLQAVDYAGLKDFASAADCLVVLQQRPGKPIENGCVLCAIFTRDKLDKKSIARICKHFILGPQPTPEQDVEFAVRQLVQVAVRALSPGVNDPFTAMTCIDRLGFALCFLCGRAKVNTIEYDRQSKARLIIKIPNFEGVMDAAFNQIRQSSEKTLSVSIRLLESFTRIAQHCRTQEQRDAVIKHGEMVYGTMAEAVTNDYDRRDLQDRYEALRTQLLRTG